MLKQLPEFKDADIVRSRDPEVLKDLDVVIDVGGTYEPGNYRNQSLDVNFACAPHPSVSLWPLLCWQCSAKLQAANEVSIISMRHGARSGASFDDTVNQLLTGMQRPSDSTTINEGSKRCLATVGSVQLMPYVAHASSAAYCDMKVHHLPVANER